MAAARGSSARRPSRPQQRTHPWPPGSAAASRASADPIAATAPTAFAGPAPFRKWLPSTTPPRRLGVAIDAEKRSRSWPGVLAAAELKIERRATLSSAGQKGLGRLRTSRATRVGVEQSVWTSTESCFSQPWARRRSASRPNRSVGRAGGGLVGAAHLVDANRTGRVGGAEECEQQLGSAVALSPQVLKESQRLDG